MKTQLEVDRLRTPTARWVSGQFRLLLFGACVLTVAGLAIAVASARAESWTALVCLAVLFVAAENRDRVFSDETGLSGSIAVALAAAAFFALDGWIWGAFVVGVCGGLYIPHLRRREFSKVVVNSAGFGVSALAASALVSLVANPEPTSAALWLALVGCTAVYWIVNSALLGLALASLSRTSVLGSIWALIRSETVMLVFGLGGALCGLVMVEVGMWVGMATLVALLVALDVFVISAPGGLVDLRTAWLVLATRGVSGGVAGTVSALVTRAVSISVLGAFTGLIAGFVAGIAVMALIVGVRFVVKYGRADLPTISGLLAVESIVPLVAALSGAAVAVAGFEVGLLIASALVIGVSIFVAVLRHRAAKAPAIADEDTLMAAVVEAMMDGLPVRER